MSTPRIPPVPPNKGGELDKTAPTEHRKIEKVEKISKVSEVDDESRAKQFRQFVEAEDEVPSTLPTPFSLFGTSAESSPVAPVTESVSSEDPTSSEVLSSDDSSNSSLDETAETAVPNPTYSPSPVNYLNDTVIESENDDDPPLPQSQQFWQNTEEPIESDQPPMQPQMEETARSASRNFSNQQSNQASSTQNGSTPSTNTSGALSKKNKKDALSDKNASMKESSFSPFGPPGKPRMGSQQDTISSHKAKELTASKHSEHELDPSLPAKKGDSLKAPPFLLREEPRKKSVGPEGVIAPRGPEGVKYVGPIASEKPDATSSPQSIPPEERLGSQLSRSLKEEREQRPAWSDKKSVEMRKESTKFEKKETGFKDPIQNKEKEEEKGKKKSHKEENDSTQIASPTTASLPEFVIPMASTAAAAAKPYLGPETLSMYFHIIGTITAMVSPKGDSRTEFVLNAPSFANSKFYGSTISIERFSTAPYQLNIRLTGSNDAVTAFNQNIPNLLSAFQTGHFSFTVNRIEAAYEKPLFHRKESAGDKGGGFDGSKDNRKR